jgi:hypothetical protein
MEKGRFPREAPFYSAGIKPFFAFSNPNRLRCEIPAGNGMNQSVSNNVRKAKCFFPPKQNALHIWLPLSRNVHTSIRYDSWQVSSFTAR